MVSCDLVVSVKAAAVMFASLGMPLCVILSHSDGTAKAVVTKPSFDSGNVFSLEYIFCS